MLARAHGFTIDALTAQPVTIEVDIRAGLPSTTVIGYGDADAREVRETVRAAVLNSGFVYPDQRVTINVAPARLRRTVPGLSFPVALAVLAASGQLDPGALQHTAAYARLKLSGDLEDRVDGVLAAAAACPSSAITRLLVAPSSATDAGLIEDLEPLPVADLADAVRVLSGLPRRRTLRVDRQAAAFTEDSLAGPDLSDLRCDPTGIFALEVAAAGGHHLLLEGPARAGLTMLARRLPGIMAPLTASEQLQVATIRSIAGLSHTLRSDPPFRAPHYTISPAGLVGGGSPVRPGEATLADQGVLYLDDLDEFQRSTLDALREPLQQRQVTVIRGAHAHTLPTSFLLIGAVRTSAEQSAGDVQRRERRLASIARYLDLRVRIRPVATEDLSHPALTDSRTVQARVIAARARQAARGQTVLNSDLPGRDVARRCTPAALAMIERSCQVAAVSPAGRQQALRVAQTIADLYFPTDSGRVDEDCVLEASAYTRQFAAAARS